MDSVRDSEALAVALRETRDALSLVMNHAPGYDWNADPLGLTLITGRAFATSETLLSDPASSEIDRLRSMLKGIVNHWYEFSDQPGCAGLDERMAAAWDYLRSKGMTPPASGRPGPAGGDEEE